MELQVSINSALLLSTMTMRTSILIPVILILSLTTSDAHVKFIEPLSRASFGHEGYGRPKCKLLPNYDDSALYCGGLAVQHNSINKGRCGICGDEFSKNHDHQAGGK